MGNTLGKMCCCHSKAEEETSSAEEIQMQEFSHNEDSNNDESNIEDGSLLDSLKSETDAETDAETEAEKETEEVETEVETEAEKEDLNESFRFRIVAEHIHSPNRSVKKEYREMYNTLIPINHITNSVRMNLSSVIFHISVFNDNNERVVDLTLYQGMGPNPKIEHFLYWKDTEENTWRLNLSFEEDEILNRQYRISSLRKIFIWAATQHTKTNSEDNKILMLSKSPGAIPVPRYIRESVGCVAHVTAYNLLLARTLDVILIQCKRANNQSECYVQWRDPYTEKPRSGFHNINSDEAFLHVFN